MDQVPNTHTLTPGRKLWHPLRYWSLGIECSTLCEKRSARVRDLLRQRCAIGDAVSAECRTVESGTLSEDERLLATAAANTGSERRVGRIASGTRRLRNARRRDHFEPSLGLEAALVGDCRCTNLGFLRLDWPVIALVE